MLNIRNSRPPYVHFVSLTPEFGLVNAQAMSRTYDATQPQLLFLKTAIKRERKINQDSKDPF